MKKKKFFKRQNKEYKRVKKERIKKQESKNKLTPEEVKARKKAQRTLMFKKKPSTDKKI